MNTPWGTGIDSEGPDMPFGTMDRDQAYQPTRIPGYEVHYGAYHTLTKGVFLPAGTILPGGCNFAQGAVNITEHIMTRLRLITAITAQVIDFPMHFPKETTCPGGIMVPVCLIKKEEKKEKSPDHSPDSYCSIQ